MDNKKYVYLVTINWQTDDDKDVEIYAFSTYQKALAFFNKSIENEKTKPEISWVANHFDKKGNPDDDCELEFDFCGIEREADLYWNFANEWHDQFTNISLDKKELDENEKH